MGCLRHCSGVACRWLAWQCQPVALGRSEQQCQSGRSTLDRNVGDSAKPSLPGNPQTFRNQSLRVIVHTSVGGTKVRIKISNTFSDQSLVIGRNLLSAVYTTKVFSVKINQAVIRCPAVPQVPGIPINSQDKPIGFCSLEWTKLLCELP
jgi:hypothetical protein